MVNHVASAPPQLFLPRFFGAKNPALFKAVAIKEFWIFHPALTETMAVSDRFVIFLIPSLSFSVPRPPPERFPNWTLGA